MLRRHRALLRCGSNTRRPPDVRKRIGENDRLAFAPLGYCSVTVVQGQCVERGGDQFPICQFIYVGDTRPSAPQLKRGMFHSEQIFPPKEALGIEALS